MNICQRCKTQLPENIKNCPVCRDRDNKLSRNDLTQPSNQTNKTELESILPKAIFSRRMLDSLSPIPVFVTDDPQLKNAQMECIGLYYALIAKFGNNYGQALELIKKNGFDRINKTIAYLACENKIELTLALQEYTGTSLKNAKAILTDNYWNLQAAIQQTKNAGLA